jgi:hypothetical protein
VIRIWAAARNRASVGLPFRKKHEQPYNVTAKDVPLTQLIMRTRPVNEAPATGVPPASSRERSSITSLTLLRAKAGSLQGILTG